MARDTFTYKHTETVSRGQHDDLEVTVSITAGKHLLHVDRAIALLRTAVVALQTEIRKDRGNTKIGEAIGKIEDYVSVLEREPL